MADSLDQDFSRLLDAGKIANPNDTQGTYLDSVAPTKILGDGRFIRDVRNFYYGRDGKTFGSDQEAIDYFYSDRTWRNTNSISIGKDLVDVLGFSPDQLQRYSRLSTAYEKLPNFYEQGGRSAFDAITQGLAAAVTDPINLLGAGTGKIAATAAMEGAGKPALTAIAKGAAQDAAINFGIGAGQNLAIQNTQRLAGMRDGLSLGEAAEGAAMGAAFAAPIGALFSIPQALTGSKLGAALKNAVDTQDAAAYSKAYGAIVSEYGEKFALNNKIASTLPGAEEAARAAQEAADVAARGESVFTSPHAEALYSINDELKHLNERFVKNDFPDAEARAEAEAQYRNLSEAMKIIQETEQLIANKKLKEDAARKAAEAGDEAKAAVLRNEAIKIDSEINDKRLQTIANQQDAERVIAEANAAREERANRPQLEDQNARSDLATPGENVGAGKQKVGEVTPNSQSEAGIFDPERTATDRFPSEGDVPAGGNGELLAQGRRENLAPEGIDAAAAGDTPTLRSETETPKPQFTREERNAVWQEYHAATGMTPQTAGKELAKLGINWRTDEGVVELKKQIADIKEKKRVSETLDSIAEAFGMSEAERAQLAEVLGAKPGDGPPDNLFKMSADIETRLLEAARLIGEQKTAGLPEKLRTSAMAEIERMVPGFSSKIGAALVEASDHEALAKAMSDAIDTIAKRYENQATRNAGDLPNASRLGGQDVDVALAQRPNTPFFDPTQTSSAVRNLSSDPEAIRQAMALAESTQPSTPPTKPDSGLRGLEAEVARLRAEGQQKQIASLDKDISGLDNFRSMMFGKLVDAVGDKDTVVKMLQSGRASGLDGDAKEFYNAYKNATKKQKRLKEKYDELTKRASSESAPPSEPKPAATTPEAKIKEVIETSVLPPLSKEQLDVLFKAKAEGGDEAALRAYAEMRGKALPATAIIPAPEIPKGMVPAITLRNAKGEPVQTRALNPKQIVQGRSLDDYYKILKGQTPGSWEEGFAAEGSHTNPIAAKRSFANRAEDVPQASSIVKMDDIMHKEVEFQGKTTTYEKLWNDFIAGENTRPSNITELEARIAHYRELEKVFPSNMLLPQGTRREAITTLKQIYANNPAAFVAAENMLRRLKVEFDRAPIIRQETDRFAAGSVNPNPRENTLSINPDASKITQKLSADHIFAHELGHWGYLNLLSFNDRADFLDFTRRFYNEKGEFDGRSLVKFLGEGRDQVPGALKNPQELFANLFAAFVDNNNVTPFRTHSSLWGRIAEIFGETIAAFLRPWDTPRELVPLFRKIIPDEGIASRWERDYISPADAGLRGKQLENAKQTMKFMAQARTHGIILDEALNSLSADNIMSAITDAKSFLYGRTRPGNSRSLFPKGPGHEPVAQRIREIRLAQREAHEFVNAQRTGEPVASSELDRLIKEQYDEMVRDGLVDNEVSALAEARVAGLSIIDSSQVAARGFDDPEFVVTAFGVANKLQNAMGDYMNIVENMYKRQTNYLPAPLNALGNFEPAKPATARRFAAARRAANAAKDEQASAERRAERTVTKPATAKEKGERAPSRAATGEVKPTAVQQLAPSQLSTLDLIREFKEERPNTTRGIELANELADRRRAKPEVANIKLPPEIDDLTDAQLRKNLQTSLRQGDKQASTLYASALAARRGDAGLVDIFESRISNAVDRELKHRQGESLEVGIPPNAPESEKALLRAVAHNNPEIDRFSKTILSRILNLLPDEARMHIGETEVLPIETIYKMAGKEVPANARAVFTDLSDPAYKELRSTVRRLAIGVRENTNPFDVVHEIGHLLSRTMLSDEDRAIMRDAFSVAKDDIADRIRKAYPDLSFEHQAEEYIAQSVAMHLGERVAKGDLMRLHVEGHADGVRLKTGIERIFDQIKEAIAYVFNRLIGNKDMRQVMRQLTWYGDMFGRSTSAERSINFSNILSGLPVMSVETDVKKALKMMSPNQLAKLRNHHTFYDRNNSPVLFWHGTPNGSALGDRGVEIRFTNEGDGYFGYGFYAAEKNFKVAQGYANAATPNALESQYSAVLARLKTPEEKQRFIQLHSERVALQDAMGMGFLSKNMHDNYVRQLADLNEQLGREFGVASRVVPVSMSIRNPFDFRVGSQHTLGHVAFSGLTDPSIEKLVDKLIEKKFVDPDIRLAFNDERVVNDRLGSGEYNQFFAYPEKDGHLTISGQDLHTWLVHEIADYLDVPTNEGGGTARGSKGAEDFLVDALKAAGYDGLRGTETSGMTGTVMTYDMALAFEKPGQVKHLLEAVDYNRDSSLFYNSVIPNGDTPKLSLNGAMLNALITGDGEISASRFGAALSPWIEFSGGSSWMSDLFRKIIKKDVRAADGLKEFSAPVQLRSNSSRMREYAGARWLADFISPENGTGFYERLHSSISKQLNPIVTMLHDLPDAKGALGEYLRKASDLTVGLTHKQHIQPDSHKRIASAIRRGDDAIKRLAPEERKAAEMIVDFFNDYSTRLEDSGVRMGRIGDYLPQLWDVEALHADREGFVMGLANYFQRESAADQARELLSRGDALRRAEKVFATLTDQDGFSHAPIAGGRRSPIMDSEMQRMIRLDRDHKALAELEKYLVNDLTGLVTKYSDGAERRIAFADKFGLSNHGYYDYLQTGVFGEDAARTLLSTRKILQNTSTAIGPHNEVMKEVTHELTMIPMREDQAAIAVRAAKERLAAGGSAQDAFDAIMQVRKQTGITDVDGGKTFEKRAMAIASALADMPNGIARSEVDHMEATFRAIQNKRVYTGVGAEGAYSISRGLRNLNSVSLLGFTTLTSLSDLAMPAIRSGSMKATYKALKAFASDPTYREAIRNIGVSVENLVHERYASLYGGQTAGIFDGRRTNAFFNATLLTPWTNMMREVAGIHGYEAMRAMVEKAQKNYRPESASQNRDFRVAKRFLDHYGLGEYATDPSKYIGDLKLIGSKDGDDTVRSAIIKFANESIFTPNPNDVPVWAQTPWGMLAWQLKSFPTMMTRLTGQVLEEAKAGNVAPLVMMLSLGAGAGMGSIYMKDMIQGRGGDEKGTGEFAPRARSYQKIAEQFGFKGRNPGHVNVMGVDVNLDTFLGWYIEGFLSMGGFGLVSDMLYQVGENLDNSQYGMNRAASFVLGPTYGLAQSAFTTASGIEHALLGEDGTNYRERAAAREIASRVPILGGIKPFRENATNEVAGERSTNRMNAKGGGFGGFGGFSGF